ncbi:hypothetical protein [Streptomyces sp. CFMR 7]|uniref:hypothetical protein n=1 Tax=Streptomyces sp. CFMR 7 TaxID=1649184 RepID=UPI0006AD2D91|nr:hypothetical protein [Streptomyces sp. CFMR 7]ALC32347.1 hypothetical protein ABE83_34945 [Streptomyces sp. CFMR 7]
MARSSRSEPDRPCVLPGDPAWIQDARYLDEDLLSSIAVLARVADDYRYVLPAIAYDAAAGLIGRLADQLPAAPEGQLYLLALPAWELEHLWSVLQVLRRVRAGDPETGELYELLQELEQGPLPCTVDQCLVDLQRVVAVLTLDIPAVRTLATALALGGPRDAAAHQAYDEVQAAWAAFGAM